MRSYVTYGITAGYAKLTNNDLLTLRLHQTANPKTDVKTGAILAGYIDYIR